MSDQATPTATAIAPVVPAPAPNVEPTSTPPAPVTPPLADPPPVVDNNDPLADAFARSMGIMRGEPEKPIEPAPETPPPTPAPPTPAATAPTTPAPAPSKKKVSVITKKDSEFIEQLPAPIAPATVAPVSALPVDADEAYISTLTADQREELREAEVAERLFPERKGFKKNLVEFFRGFDDKAKALIAADPNRTLDESDEDFQKVVKSKPVLRPQESKKVQRQIGIDETKAEVDSKVKPELEDIKQNQRRIELQPKIEQWVNTSFVQGVKALVDSDPKSAVSEAAKVINEKGPEEAEKLFPLELMIMREEGQFARERASAFLLLKNQAVRFDPKNQIHMNVANFIKGEGEAFADKGGKFNVKGGRQFLPRAEFNSMVASNRAESETLDQQKWRTKSYWTFTDTEIVDFLALDTKNRIEGRVNYELEQAKKKGFERRPRPQSAAPQTPPTELNPPRATSTPAPASAEPPKPAVTNTGLDVAATLYR